MNHKGRLCFLFNKAGEVFIKGIQSVNLVKKQLMVTLANNKSKHY